ncbi:DUF2513 domain-containing protein [Gluconobacter wancherniae]|uniref:DUF2513 domain-containing protein n=1 Tax=Gluconobacter wancherniae TaxID=1307955 RepID=UPI001B8D340A|nr:DUF2513 domain-containing protein [Gluconobacter wancherniae]MBS1063604.1 DUF2513 domain-containing protein [Gluconobacter wancherniae]
MRRDMDLVRQLLLKLESIKKGPHEVFLLSGNSEVVAVEGRTSDEIYFHLTKIEEAGFLERVGGGAMTAVSFRALSWKGQEFLDNIREDSIWQKTKEKAGSASFDVLSAIAKAILKDRIRSLTGLDLD